MSQNINQYPRPNWGVKLVSEANDMSLVSDEKNFNEEVIFSPYLIAQTYGDRLPFSFDTDNTLSVQPLSLSYKQYNFDNVFVSTNYYNPDNVDLSCLTANTSCDIGLTGIDNGLVTGMTEQTITFTNGINDFTKFDRLSFDRRLKMFQVTGYTSSNVRFSGFDKTILYEVVSKNDSVGYYHELYGGFYQGFYKLFGYDYEIFPERTNKGWSVEMLLKPRLVNEYEPSSGETTLNEIYPNNKDMFFYFGARAENKFYHYADGHPRCLTGYTRVTSEVTGLTTCSCCVNSIINSRCIYVYPPRPTKSDCDGCITCGWEYKLHDCPSPTPTPTPTPTPVPLPSNCEPITACTAGCTCLICTTCNDCEVCLDCNLTPGSVENTCESDPLFDSMSNAFAMKLCGEPNNPQIGVRILRFTGGCETSGTCSTTGITYTTGYTIDNYCTPPIYPYCLEVNPSYLDIEHWFHITAVWERYTWLNTCDLWYRGGIGDITEKKYLDGLAGNSKELITVPYTQTCGKDPEKIELVNLNEKWLIDKDFRKGRLKIYINGRIFHTFENIEEIIPRALSTDKEKQVGVPYNISWGGGTQGLRENLTFSSTTGTTYIQDPECLPTNDLIGTTFSGLTTDILLEQNFAGSFDGGISQFRMYVEPLSADEVKHNFNLLKDTFNMFNPDCPDCGEFCPIDDFTYVITTPEELPPFQLGRIHIPDARDNNYLIKDHFQFIKSVTKVTPLVTKTPTPTPTKTPTPTPTKTLTPTPTKTRNVTPTPTPTPTHTNYITPTPTKSVTPTPTNTVTSTPTPTITGLTSRYWDDNVWWGNQGNTPMCVGYAWAHWIADGPVTHQGVQPPIAPDLIYHEAQKVDEWVGECVDMETKCLSFDKGWINGYELEEGDIILTYDIEKDGLVWKPIQKVHLYSNKKYRKWSQKGFEIAVTDNHKWVVSNYNMKNKKYSLVETKNLKTQHEILLMSSNGVIEEVCDNNEYSDDFIKIVSWVITEGSYRPNNRRGTGITISQKKYFDEVNELLLRNGVSKGHKTKTNCHVWEINGSLSKKIREIAPNRTPTNKWLSSLSKRQLKLFIDTCILGDGSIIKKINNRKERKQFHQKQVGILDSFIYACLLVGYSVSRSGLQTSSLNPVETWSIRQSYHKSIKKLSTSDYLTGDVWCPQTESGTFVAKRNGNIFITGNSYQGTSVRGGAKYLNTSGKITNYYWAYDLQTLINTILQLGPVVVGTNWYYNMFYPNSNGVISIGGSLAGGHAYVLNGVDTINKLFRIKNSWGQSWGKQGHAFISFTDMTRLINENGEICLAIENNF